MKLRRPWIIVTAAVILLLASVVGTRTYGIYREIQMMRMMEVVLDRFPTTDLSDGERYSLELSTGLVKGRIAFLREGWFSGFCCRLIDLYDDILA